MITTILSKINLIKTSNNVLWNIFHKTLIFSVFIHVNNFILSQLRQPPTTSLNHFVDFISIVLVVSVVSSTTVSCILFPCHVSHSDLVFGFWRDSWRLSSFTVNFLFFLSFLSLNMSHACSTS